MFKFTQTERSMPEKRDASSRLQDFKEIYNDYAQSAASAQSARCSQCGVPFCQQGCPLSNNIPDWLMLAANDRLKEAYQVSATTNNMPEICGRICPQDRLCEGICTIEQSGHGTVTIGAIEKYITDTAWNNGWVRPIKPVVEREQSVGIIGAGPAGLAAAEQLRRKGYQVSIYDRYDRGGGLLIYGIPGFKLEKCVVNRRIDLLQESGVEFQLEVDIGDSVGLQELRDRHDSILIATGAYKAHELSVPGSGNPNVIPALTYLTASNRSDLGDPENLSNSQAFNVKDKRVVVIGGGDTSMDCVRTAVRQGAKSVVCLYRRDRANMPGSAREVANAEEEGVVFEWLATPEAIVEKHDQTIGAVRATKMALGELDASGRKSPVKTDETFDVAADVVIKALGFDPEDLPHLFDQPQLVVNRRGAVRIDFATMQTSLEGVYAAGDIVRGASLVVWAIKDGRDAAESMDHFMKLKRKL